MRAFGYGRVSTEEQDLATQERLFGEEIEEFGDTDATLVAWFDDKESGTTRNRDAWQEMLSRVGEVEVIYFAKLDRVARSELVWHTFRDACDRAGTRLVSLDPHESFVGGDDNASRQLESATASQAAGYSRDVSAHTRRGQNGSVAKGLSPQGKVPYGYRSQRRDWSADGKKLVRQPWVVVEREAEVVRRIVDSYLAGIGTTAIAKALNDDGVPGPSSPKWGDGTVRLILDNGIYSGVLVRGRVRKAGPQKDAREVPQPEDEWTVVDADLEFHPPILPEGTWHKVQQTRKHRRRGHRPGKASIFSGVLKCGGCGGPMNVRHWTLKGGETVYQYRCNTHRVHGGHGCDDPSLVRESDLIGFTARKATTLISTKALAEHDAVVALASEEYDRAKRYLKALERRRERQVEGYEAGVYDLEEFQQRTVAYRAERERLEVRRDAASTEPDEALASEAIYAAVFEFSDQFTVVDELGRAQPELVGVNRGRWRQFVAEHVERLDVTGDPDDPFRVTWKLT